MSIISSNQTTTVVLSGGRNAFVLQGVAVAVESSDSPGIHSLGSNWVEVHGTVISTLSFGIYFDSGEFSHILIGETGAASGYQGGIYTAGHGTSILNEGAVVSPGGSGIFARNGAIFVGVSSTGTVSSRSVAIHAEGGGNTVVNAGEVTSSADGGIKVWGGGGTIENTATGRVSAFLAGLSAGSSGNTILNAGAVTSRAGAGIQTEGENDSILNTGEVIGHTFGIAIGLVHQSFSGNRIENRSTVAATHVTDGVGIRVNSAAGDSDNRIINHGTVSGAAWAILTGDGAETVANRGVAEGDVALGDGADTYRGAGGVVMGAVLGQGGADVLVGGALEDLLSGGDERDMLFGRGEDDLLNGGAAKDLLKGGMGEDVFDFDLVTDSPKGADRDIILDFRKGSDLIDLSSIDANSTDLGGPRPLNQAFTFIGSGPFGGTAGELRVVIKASLGITLVEGDVDGNGDADLQIELAGRIALAATDFIL